jgi:hypothetical protein
MTEVVYFRWRKEGSVWHRVVSGLAFRPTESLIASWPLFDAALQSVRIAAH